MMHAEQGGAIVQIVNMVLVIGILGSGFFGAGRRKVIVRSGWTSGETIGAGCGARWAAAQKQRRARETLGLSTNRLYNNRPYFDFITQTPFQSSPGGSAFSAAHRSR